MLSKYETVGYTACVELTRQVVELTWVDLTPSIHVLAKVICSSLYKYAIFTEDVFLNRLGATIMERLAEGRHGRRLRKERVHFGRF